MMSTDPGMDPTRDDFAALLNESFERADEYEGSVVKGRVVAIEKDVAVIDVGMKTEGRIQLKEFASGANPIELKVGDTVEVYLERVENALGEAVLSRDKARREESWTKLEVKFNNGDVVTGTIFNKVKGGFTVDLDGAVAFLPGSQVDVRPVRDIGPLMHSPQPFKILKMDRRRGNIVVSRREILEATRAEQRTEIVSRLGEGQVIDGVVKNITDYGAFIDLGGIDGLLHVTDMAWRRVNHPSEIVNVGDTVKVQIIRINSDTQRISLGMKQLQSDPWAGIEAKYPVKGKFSGTVTNIADYGAFVELEPGVEGLIHVSEMSWTNKNVHPGKIVATSQKVDVQILEVDSGKRRISLGLKQTQDNPWDAFLTVHPRGIIVEGPIRNITEFGLFIGLDNGVDGMVHLSDLAWNKQGEEAIKDFKKGDTIKAVVLDVDASKERISLGIKQMAGDPMQGLVAAKKGDQVTCEVTKVTENGLDVKIIGTELVSFIKRIDLSRDRAEQRAERFNVGDKVDGAITSIDRATKKVGVSIKALEMAEEKQVLAQYGSSYSGASLGDILGAALRKPDKSSDTDNWQFRGRKKYDWAARDYSATAIVNSSVIHLKPNKDIAQNQKMEYVIQGKRKEIDIESQKDHRFGFGDPLKTCVNAALAYETGRHELSADFLLMRQLADQSQQSLVALVLGTLQSPGATNSYVMKLLRHLCPNIGLPKYDDKSYLISALRAFRGASCLDANLSAAPSAPDILHLKLKILDEVYLGSAGVATKLDVETTASDEKIGIHATFMSDKLEDRIYRTFVPGLLLKDGSEVWVIEIPETAAGPFRCAIASKIDIVTEWRIYRKVHNHKTNRSLEIEREY